MTRRQILLALVVVLQTVSLVTMVGMKQRTLATGTPVLLETRPIDPRSLFRGDYVILGYAIGALEQQDFPNTANFERHDTIYVLLRPGDQYWEPVSIHRDRPEIPDGHVAIKGDVEGNWGIWRDGESRPGIRVRYGIENYFVPEGEGRELERPGDKTVSILAAVDSRGNAGIKAVLVDGEIRYEETLF